MSNGKVANINEILKEIQLNKACKGEGPLKAAFCSINFDSAYSAVKLMQNKGIVPFSPFKNKETNCCRFVKNGILAGLPIAKYRWRLKWIFPILPMPLTLVNLLPNEISIPEREKLEEYKFVSHFFKGLSRNQQYYNKNNVMGTLPKPVKPQNIPTDCQWLSGEVAGSWFHILQSQNGYIITRYSAEGTIECSGKFYLKTNYEFDINKPFYFTYLSHCSKVTIIQDNEILEFIRV